MNLRYVFPELTRRRRRTIMAVVGLSIGIALLVILNALSLAYHEAARAPLKEIGADITMQRPGNVPEEMAGAVFPCSAVTIKKDEIDRVGKMPGVRGVGAALLLWVFDPNRAWIVLGIEEENSIGPSILRNFVKEGRYLAAGDVNLLFIKADQDKITDLVSALKGLMGPKTTVATPDSFLKLLGSFFAVSDKFTLVASLIAVLIAFKTMAGNVAERAREIGVLKAVGWTQRNVTRQLLTESIVQYLIAGILGLAVAFAAAVALGFMTLNIPIPWEMSPTPHFLPGGGAVVYKTLRLPVHIPVTLALFAVLLSVVIGGLTGALLGRHKIEGHRD